MLILEQLKALSDDRFTAIYEALSADGFGPMDHEVARAMRFRPQAIRKVPIKRRALRARSILTSTANAEVCYELFGGYLVQTKKEVVTGFLDATGVEHKEGMIDDTEEHAPDKGKLSEAIAKLDGEHDPDDVTLYLSIAAMQWPQLPEIEEIWRQRVEKVAS